MAELRSPLNNKDYSKSKSSKMKAAPDAMGDVSKETSANGPHLKEGKGTKYNVAKITSGFMVHNPIPKKNVERVPPDEGNNP